MTTKKTNTEKSSANSVIAKSDDGTIQITFTIPYTDINEAQEGVAKEMGKDIEVPGFRKGMAPTSKVIDHVSKQTLLEKTLSKILPKLVAGAINEHKITPALYPKFELVKAVEGEDWQIRAVTCELPKIELGDYKKEISGAARAKSLWTPSSAKVIDPEVQTRRATADKPDKELTREEKEQEVIKILLEKVNLKIPHILIDEEANSRLSKLLERIEKLGLSLESYLASIGKTADMIRNEYKAQAKNAIALDLILTEIASKENITVDPKEVDAAIDASKADPKLAKDLDTPERRRFIEVILKRRKALDLLIALI